MHTSSCAPHPRPRPRELSSVSTLPHTSTLLRPPGPPFVRRPSFGCLSRPASPLSLSISLVLLGAWRLHAFMKPSLTLSFYLALVASALARAH
eukprot:scaffold39376_cov37-Tisochrysis_lutea.AAC.1